MSTIVTVVQIPVTPETVLLELEKQIREFDFLELPQTLLGDLIFFAGWVNRMQHHPATNLAECLVRDLRERPV